MALQAYPYYTFLQAALDSAPRRANYTPTYTSALCQFALALVFLLQLDCLKFFVGLSIDRTTMEPIQKFFILTITMQLELGPDNVGLTDFCFNSKKIFESNSALLKIFCVLISFVNLKT